MQEQWRRLALGVSLLCLMGLLISSVAACGATLPGAVPSHTPFLFGCLPTPTATQHTGIAQPIVSGVTFGGPPCAFGKKYGDEFAPDYRWQGLELHTTSDEAIDGELHVSELDISPLDRSITWTMPQAEQICLPFLPPDAIHQHDGQDTSGDPLQFYTSARLLATFAPSSPAYDPTGTIVLTYAVNADDAVFECDFTTHP